MKRFLFLFIMSFFVASCDGLTYDGSTKTVFEGRILDQDGAPTKYPDERTYNTGWISR